MTSPTEPTSPGAIRLTVTPDGVQHQLVLPPNVKAMLTAYFNSIEADQTEPAEPDAMVFVENPPGFTTDNGPEGGELWWRPNDDSGTWCKLALANAVHATSFEDVLTNFGMFSSPRRFERQYTIAEIRKMLGLSQ